MAEIGLLPPPKTLARTATFLLFVLAPCLIGLLGVALGQDSNWDLRNYHWYNAYAYITHRRSQDFLPSQTPWFYNPTLDVPFYLLAIHSPAKVAAFILGYVQGLNFILLFLLAHISLVIEKIWRKFIFATALATLGMLGGGGIALLGTTFYDNTTSLGIFLSALLVLTSYQPLMRCSWERILFFGILCGLPSGLMMGLKLPSTLFCVGFCGAILFMGNHWRQQFLLSFAFGIGVLIGAFITLGHWAYFLQTSFGNPFFPYFNGFFNSPLAPATSARDVQYVPNGFWNLLLFPFRFASNPYLVGEIPWRDWRLPILYTLVPLVACVRLFYRSSKHQLRFTTSESSRYLLFAASISYFLWLFMFGIYRYAVPLEMVAPLLIVLCIERAPIPTKVRASLITLLLLIVVVSISPGTWGRRTTWLDHFVETTLPPLQDPDHLMILMAGIDPYSHVLSEFPNHISFVRIESNFSQPGDGRGINEMIRQRLRSHTGSFMLLIQPYDLTNAEKALHAYGLGLKPSHKPCQTVIDRLYDDAPLSLCPVVRTTSS